MYKYIWGGKKVEIYLPKRIIESSEKGFWFRLICNVVGQV